ncbi:MAG: insulinase family protein [Bacilli bacterium]|nr:insulinase family protein [Bacilli bacterium]
MEYTKIKKETYNLHMIQTDRFKTTNIEVIFSKKITKEDITKTNVLSSIMTYTSKKYPKRLMYTRALENLYSARLFTNTYRIGNLLNVDFNMRILDDKYVSCNLLDDALSFLSEVIFNPNVSDNKFDKDSYNVVTNEEKAQIERFREDSRKYSLMKMYELLDKDSPCSYNLKGYLEDLEKLDREKLYDYYKEFIKCNNIDIFIIGDINFEKTEKIVEKNFKFKGNKRVIIEPSLISKKHREVVQEVIEDDYTNQSKLSIACRIEDMNKFEKNYVINIYNFILGGTADSKFFKNIREKYSLCYYISSGANKLDNLLIISSGFSKENYSKMLFLIKKEMEDIRKGLFEEEEIEKAKKYYISALDAINDSENQIIASYYAMDLLKTESIEKRKENILKVTKKQIVELANKVYIDTIFLLGGDKL